MDKRKLEKPKASLYPVPVALVTCGKGSSNIITIAWTGIMCSEPPIIYISVRPERYTYKLLKESRKFCLNIPGADMVSIVDYCGNVSGENLNKSEVCGLELLELLQGYPKAIKQCKHHLFCDIKEQIAFGSHDAFIAEVKSEFVDEDCYAGNHTFWHQQINPIAYCRKDYYSLGNKIGEYGKVKGEIVYESK
ncbi:flavin reductase family protein [Acutalibacter muris]|uniref:flavin reductase family protein n=1 Tax=Acutalibacter muris TaxID=1796620 RepID=UPI0026F40300|nr:flavin reductase family protein [Acutalibacter muris]